MNLGIGLSLSTPRSLVVDPTSQAVGGLWRDFAGVPWVGTASAGSSGGRTLTSADPPVVGTPLNGHGVAQTTGTKTMTSSPAALSNYIGAAWGFSILAKHGGAATGFFFQDVDAYFSCTMANGVLSVDQWDSDTTHLLVSTSIASDANYHLYQGKFSGTTMSLRIDHGAWVTGTIGPIFHTTANLSFQITTASVAEIVLAPTASLDFDGMRYAANLRYALTL